MNERSFEIDANGISRTTVFSSPVQPISICAVSRTVRYTVTLITTTSILVLSMPSHAESVETVPVIKSTTAPKPRAKAVRPTPKSEQPNMQARWQDVQVAVGPTKLLKMAEQFERDFPFSAVDQQNQALQVCAKKTLDIARTAGLSSDFFDEMSGDAIYKSRLKSAVRGDKDAAYQLALAYQTGSAGVAKNTRRAEQWLRFAADLDHAHASWQLAEIYNHEGLIADAARYEKKAADLGFPVPLRLPNRGY
ncbi:MAG: sel1 repeat family protein [Rhodocyclaceae bacterium]|nr:sel1 repeat family protein [Rhodocyclaceae bacterium]